MGWACSIDRSIELCMRVAFAGISRLCACIIAGDRELMHAWGVFVAVCLEFDKLATRLECSDITSLS
jgi:hypothetical protein